MVQEISRAVLTVVTEAETSKVTEIAPCASGEALAL